MSLQRLQKYRRDLHRIPELGLELPQTYTYIKRILETLPCTITSPIANSICAFFDGHKNETIAFRSDMDALPIKERNTHDFVSCHIGNMHACGHDGHMAMLLAFAHEVSTFYKELPHNVLLIFQPGEETPGGAELIVNTGILKTYHVTKIFGSHVWPELPKGVIATKDGEFMARASEIDITIQGKSIHVAKYHQGVDALAAGSAFLQAMYAMERNEIDTNALRLLRFGQFTSGTTRNIVSNHTNIGGSLRAFQDDIYWYMRKRIDEIKKDIEEAYHVTISIRIADGYPPVINDQVLCSDIIHKIADIEVLSKPEMIAEDFAFYQQEVPGVLFFLGTGNGIALHTNTFDFDEMILLKGVELYKKLSYL